MSACLQVYGGHKSDFNGHQKVSFNNINAYSYVYGDGCARIFGIPMPGYNEGYYNNTCILANANDPYLTYDGTCNPSSAPTVTVTTNHNAVYAPNADVSVSICGKTYSMAEWLAFNLDVGTTVGETPSTAQIIAWAAQLLNITTTTTTPQ
jgi:hypothetical protein